ncbi:MAG: protein kinase domain-containing protein [Planctomycetota bacterium]
MTDNAFTRMETEYLPPGQGPDLGAKHRVGPYEILAVVGRGGMGTVYKAKVIESCSVPIGRLVSIKMLHERHLDMMERRRFQREASYLQALRHPSIVRILDIGEHNERPFLVMQFIEGQTFDQLLDDSARRSGSRYLKEHTVCEYMVQALEALHTAHLAGILHRDLKPGNFMVTPEGQVKLLDFGMAQRLNTDSRLTASGSVLGTPAYMSPEQASGLREDLSNRSDIYSMGAVCYELLTGHQPYTAENSIAVLRRILEEPLTAPSRLRHDLSRDLETVVLKSMAKDPRDRYANAEAMAEDLRRIQEGMRVRARRLRTTVLLARSLWRHRRTLAGAGLALFILLVGGAILARRVISRLQDMRDSREGDQELLQRLQPEWRERWHHPGRLDWSATDRPKLAKRIGRSAMELISLPDVTNENVRLSAEVMPVTGRDPLLEMMICDGDIGQGYALRLESAQQEDATTAPIVLTLLRGTPGSGARERSVVSSQSVDQTFPLRLSLSKIQENIQVLVNDEQVLEPYRDPVPIEGSLNNRVHIAVAPETVQLRNVLLERQRKPELVSRLETADLMRQERRFHRAIQLYEQFLADFPEHERRKDALYRIGLCYSALGSENRDDLKRALATFQRIIADSLEDRYYYKIATAQAWISAARLGEYQLAEQYFESLRQRFELRHLLASIPKTDLLNLLKHYLHRAEDPKLARQKTERALQLLRTAADFADYLEEERAFATITLQIGDIHLGAGELQRARERYQAVAKDVALHRHLRHEGMLRVAHAERLLDSRRGFYDESLAAYHTVIGARKPRADLRAWARLWLGELYLYMGDRQQALASWTANPRTDHLPARMMAHLRSATTPFAKQGYPPEYHADIDFFNAVLLRYRADAPDIDAEQRRRLLKNLRKSLGSIVASYPASDWPVPLAQLYLGEIRVIPETMFDPDLEPEPADAGDERQTRLPEPESAPTPAP